MARISALLAAVLTLSLAPAIGAQSTAQAHAPKLELEFEHRNGQSFLIWRERADLVGESYRVYRDEVGPSGAVVTTSPLYPTGIAEGSSRFLQDRIQSVSGWEPAYLERYVVPDASSPGAVRALEDGEGLFVWTPGPEDFAVGACSDFHAGSEGCARYRVNVVHSGVESQYLVSGTRHERFFPPSPIEVTGLIDPALHVLAAGERVFTQFLDLRKFNPTLCAPNSFNAYWGLATPLSPSDRSQLAYAFNYVIFEPADNCECGPHEGSKPVVVVLHHYGGSNRRPEDTFPSWCAWRVYPIDTMETWWFGFAESHDYRTGADLSGAAGESIANFTEQRVIRMLFDMPQTVGSVDHQRIYATGWSMGGGGALGLAMRFPNVFAAAYAHKPVTRYETSPDVFFEDMVLKWGPPSLALPIVLDAPMGLADPIAAHAGTSIWDWQDHALQALVRQAEPMAPFGVLTAVDDPILPWAEQAAPTYEALDMGRHAWGGVSRATGGHSWSPYNDSFTGLPPTLRFDPACLVQPGSATHPFFDFQVVKSETLPGLSSSVAQPLNEIDVNNEIEWSASWYPWDADMPLTAGAPVDTPELWRVSLRTTVPESRTIALTPRRIQAFEVLPGRWYSWESRQMGGAGLAKLGMVRASPDAMLTLEHVLVPSRFSAESGVRVRLAPYTLKNTTPAGTAGTAIRIKAEGSSPLKMQHLFISSIGPGSTPWGPASIELDQATLHASSLSDGAGVVNFTILLPTPPGSNPAYWFQVIESTTEVHATGVLRVPLL